MNLTMTVGTKQDTFAQLLFDTIPASRMTALRNAEIFLRSVCMMEFESFLTIMIATSIAFSSELFNGLFPNSFPSFLDCFNKIFSSV